MYAITAAGVSHAITQACSMGELLQCGCELTRSRAPPSPTVGPGMEGTAWEWGGCGDDVQFGYEKSQQFMDAKSKKGKNDIRALIDLHNNEAGRLVRPPSFLPSTSPPCAPTHLNPPSYTFSKPGTCTKFEIWSQYLSGAHCGCFGSPLWPPQHPPPGQGITKRQGFDWRFWTGRQEPKAEHRHLFPRRCAAT